MRSAVAADKEDMVFLCLYVSLSLSLSVSVSLSLSFSLFLSLSLPLSLSLSPFHFHGNCKIAMLALLETGQLEGALGHLAMIPEVPTVATG